MPGPRHALRHVRRRHTPAHALPAAPQERHHPHRPARQRAIRRLQAGLYRPDGTRIRRLLPYVIVFDSNIRKYRIKSEENSKNPLYGKNVTNLYKRKNFNISNQDISKNINNRYNKSTNYTYNVPNKSSYVDERQIQRGAQRNNDKKCICGRSCECQNSDVINYQRLNKRNTYSTQTKPTSNINRPRIDNKYKRIPSNQ